MARHALLGNKLTVLNSSSPFAKLLDACIKSKSSRDTRTVHSQIIKSQFSDEIFINNRLIDAYGKCGCFDYAREVFDKMPDRNTFTYNSMIGTLTILGSVTEAEMLFSSMPQPDQCSWNLMVSGFAQHELFDKSVEYFVEMHGKDFVLNEYSYGSGLSACAGLRDLVASVKNARAMFTKMMERNVVSWNALIAGYTQNGDNEEALGLFLLLKRESVLPTHYTFGNLLNACASLADLKLGRQAHVHILKHGFRFQYGPEPDVFVDVGDLDADEEQNKAELTMLQELEIPLFAAVR
ncbi:unnamed protein product [Fraxinus pennsylvanica]|uniref:Pentatricopeptide repeat-containing protein n=1 Tax=Fraxinus pennsylvanica TaxID=56036 RepID=A0AAD2DN73_9LAMI|nr:unnamed protein product [Fraxinus pennsylvanica]